MAFPSTYGSISTSSRRLKKAYSPSSIPFNTLATTTSSSLVLDPLQTSYCWYGQALEHKADILKSKRLYYVITTLITIFASLSYFAMATGHGVSYNHVRVRHSHNHIPDTFHDVYRQVFWARYVDWSLTTPLILIDLGLLAGLSGAHLLIAIIADVIMILTGMFAAFGSEGTPQKWGWYAIGCISYLVVIWHLAVNGRAQAKAKGSKVGRFFVSIAGFTIIVWTAYPM